MNENPNLNMFSKKLLDIEYNGLSFISSGYHVKNDVPFHNSLRKVLNLNDDDLSKKSKLIIKFLEDSSEFKDKYSDLSWQVQAWFEFQDILETSFELQNGNEQLINNHYCYFEATRILIESLITGLEGHFNASISLLRSFIELAVLEVYFKEKSTVDGNHKRFLRWFSYESGNTPFKNTVDFIFTKEENRNFNIVKDRINGSYKDTSIYAHKPRLNSSFTVMRKSNTLNPSLESIFYWAYFSSIVLQSILWLYVISYPMCLFPVDIVKKFGYNWPMGVFFDSSNSKILERALEHNDYIAFQNDLKNHPDVEKKMEFYNSTSSKNKEYIEESWTGLMDSNFENFHSKDERIAAFKAKFRAISWALSYKAPLKDFSEIDIDESKLRYYKK